MPIDTAVILAAGAGTRLRAAADSKPLCVVAGKTLLDHALERLAEAGIVRAIVVTGYRAEAIEGHIAARDWPLAVETVRTPDWQLPNGVSALAAAKALAGSASLLAMCDHLVEPALYARMAAAGARDGLRLGVDRRLGHPWVDLDDVTFVATAGTRIVAIGKGMDTYDAYDTGVFAVGQPFFDALAGLDAPSITEAVRALAARGAAEVVECSDLTWIDVDDPKALAAAEGWLGT
jgi:1L-myo-inositol 1-phosphate cytidylyltransferase